MSFDARSRERLEALGRTLPQKLPLPASPSRQGPVPAGRTSDSAPRHRLETEENPEDLFRVLIEASTDGSVPPHLLERLRDLETARPERHHGTTAEPGQGSGSPTGADREGPTRIPSPRPRRPGSNAKTSTPRRATGPERDLYDTFDDLLHLERHDDADPGPSPRRLADNPLLPRPTLRRERPGR